MKEYFVIGGEFTSLNFHNFKPGTQYVSVPFADRKLAEAHWKVMAENTRSNANMRYLIVENAAG